MYDDIVYQESNSSNNSCSQFTNFHKIVIMRSAFAAVGAFASIIAIFIIILAKAHSQYMYRLMLYLSVVTFIVCVLYMLRQLPIEATDGGLVSVRKGYGWLCAASAYAFINLQWTKVIISFWITAYLFVLVVFSKQFNKRNHEIFGLAFAVLAPLTITWLPFIHNMYGISGPFCSIKVTRRPCTSDVTLGMSYLMSIYYMPFLLVVALNFLAMATIAASLCKRWLVGRTVLQNHYKSALRDALPFLLYPALSDAITLFGLINRIYYGFYTVRENKSTNETLWYTQIALSPLDGVFIPVILFFHQLSLRHIRRRSYSKSKSRHKAANKNKKVNCNENKPTSSSNVGSTTQFIVAKQDDFTEVEPLVVKSSITRKIYSDVEVTV